MGEGRLGLSRPQSKVGGLRRAPAGTCRVGRAPCPGCPLADGMSPPAQHRACGFWGECPEKQQPPGHF